MSNGKTVSGFLDGFGTLQDVQESIDPAELRLKSKVPATLRNRTFSCFGSEKGGLAL